MALNIMNNIIWRSIWWSGWKKYSPCIAFPMLSWMGFCPSLAHGIQILAPALWCSLKFISNLEKSSKETNLMKIDKYILRTQASNTLIASWLVAFKCILVHFKKHHNLIKKKEHQYNSTLTWIVLRSLPTSRPCNNYCFQLAFF